MRRALLALCGLLLAAAPAASAAVRYVKPAAAGAFGTGDCLTVDTACEINYAVETRAEANDELQLLPGTYEFGGMGDGLAVTTPGLWIHGAPSQSRPVLRGDQQGYVVASTAGLRLSDVDVIGETAKGVDTGPEATLERVRVRGFFTGNGEVLVRLGDHAVVRDSAVAAFAPEALAIGLHGQDADVRATLENVTATASGSQLDPTNAAVGVEVSGCGPCTTTLFLVNVIARAGNRSRSDLFASASLPASAVLDVRTSSFGSYRLAGDGAQLLAANAQSQAPDLLLEDGFLYHQVAGSPTIDAGAARMPGAFDLDGDARSLGAAPDIGADEFVPPPSGRDTTKPRIRGLSLSRKVFAVARRPTPRRARGAAVRGTRVRYRLSEASTVRFGIRRRSARTGRYRKVGALTRSAQAGRNVLAFSGRIGRRPLRPGRYRMLMRARDAAGNRSPLRVLPFRIVRG